MEKAPEKLEDGISTANYGPNENRRIFKNVITVSLSFMLLFTAYSTTSGLQSSLNSKNGMGQYSLAITYTAIVISTIFIPSLAIRKLSVKWAISLSMLGYSSYIAVQFAPSFYTLIPAGILVGICAAPLWIGKCTYLTIAAREYAKIKGENPEAVVTHFFGIFFCIFQTASVWGNLISSLVLSHGLRGSNSSEITEISHCGVDFCPGDPVGSSNAKDDLGSTFHLLAGIFLVCSFAAPALTAAVVDPLSRYEEKNKGTDDEKPSGMNLLFATFKQMKNSYQFLIIPLTIWSGIQQGFLGSDITSAFITCSWGVDKVGYVLICYGAFDAISSVLFGVIAKYTGRMAIFCLGALINVAMIVFMFHWKPNPEAPVMYFVLVAFWGTGDAIWQTQINGLYGALFPKNTAAAFSNYRLWESTGFIFAYVMSTNLCIRFKLFVLIGFILTGMIGYFTIEYLLKQKGAEAQETKEIK